MEVGRAADDGEGRNQAAHEAQHGRKSHQRHTSGLQLSARQGARCRQERQVGDGRGQAHLEQGLGPADVACLTNAQLH
jgi:hypothetical protein